MWPSCNLTMWYCQTNGTARMDVLLATWSYHKSDSLLPQITAAPRESLVPEVPTSSRSVAEHEGARVTLHHWRPVGSGLQAQPCEPSNLLTDSVVVSFKSLLRAAGKPRSSLDLTGGRSSSSISPEDKAWAERRIIWDCSVAHSMTCEPCDTFR
jgi:hypothetical protein